MSVFLDFFSLVARKVMDEPKQLQHAHTYALWLLFGFKKKKVRVQKRKNFSSDEQQLHSAGCLGHASPPANQLPASEGDVTEDEAGRQDEYV